MSYPNPEAYTQPCRREQAALNCAAKRKSPGWPKLTCAPESPRLKSRLMSAHYQQLLEATIQYLEELKLRGARVVPVSPATLAALAGSPPVRPQPASRPPRK